MANGTCYDRCNEMPSVDDCLRECMDNPTSSSLCTILSASLFFVGVLIGAIATIVLVHCCCHNKNTGNKREASKRRRKAENSYNQGPFHARQEKRRAPKSPAHTKNQRQISPSVSSSTTLIDLTWTPTHENSFGQQQKLRSSLSEDRLDNAFRHVEQPSYDVTNMSATWDTALEEEHSKTQKSLRQPRVISG